jgi:hypothetical protein
MVKSDLTSVLEVSFPRVVGRAEHRHLLGCFRSVRLFLFHRCGGKVGLEILALGPKSSSIRWRRYSARVCLFGSPSVTTCLPCRSLSSMLGPRYMVKILIPRLGRISLWRISPFLQFLIKNRQPEPADLLHHATVGSSLLDPTKLSLVRWPCGS